jgi:hypothetical protein
MLTKPNGYVFGEADVILAGIILKHVDTIVQTASENWLRG